MPDSIIILAQQQRRRLIARDEAALRRVTAAYGRIYTRIAAEAELLGVDVAEMGSITPAAIHKLERYQALLKQVQAELDRFSTWLGMELPDTARGMIDLAGADTAGLIRAYGIRAGFDNLPAAAIERLLGFLDPSGPLYDRLGRLGEFTARRLGDLLLEGLALGKNPRTVAREIAREGLGMGLTDALRMTRTVNLYSYREASRANYQANSDVVEAYQWYAELDGDTCMACIAEHGKVYPLSEPLDGHYNCIVGDTLVDALAPVTAFTARRYDGEVIRIKTASGKNLTVTPNHPVLTRRGWIAAQRLVEGDDVICYSGDKGRASGIYPDENHRPAAIEDIFRTAAVNGFRSVPTTAEDFHGDGKQGEVKIVTTNRFLMGEVVPAICQPFAQQGFGGGNVPLVGFAPCGAAAHSFFTEPAFFDGTMTSGSNAGVFFGRSTRSHQAVGVSLSSRGYVFSDKDVSDYVTRGVESLSDTVLRFASNVTGGDFVMGQLVPDRVMEIVRSSYSGHVYNLETQNSWYTSNSIITHNCRCTMLPVLVGMDSTIQTGEEWFRGQSAAQQSKQMGPGRYSAWQEGKFEFGQLSREHDDPIYGRMKGEAALKDLVTEE